MRDSIVTYIIFLIFSFSLLEIIDLKHEQMKHVQMMEQVRQLKVQEEVPLEEKEGSKFDSLIEINPDFVGWIKIENTQIDYPVVQGEDNEYYLSKNFQKQDAKSGSIFMDYRNELTSDKHIILYGHRMKDGTMFGELSNFLNVDFFLSSPSIYLETPEKNYRFEVFSTYLTTTDFFYIQTDFTDDNEYLSFLQTIYDKSVYKREVEMTSDMKILTLSTCDFAINPVKGRLVVHARMIDD